MNTCMRGGVSSNISGREEQKRELLLFREQCFDMVRFESSRRLHCKFLWKAVLLVLLESVGGENQL